MIKTRAKGRAGASTMIVRSPMFWAAVVIVSVAMMTSQRATTDYSFVSFSAASKPIVEAFSAASKPIVEANFIKKRQGDGWEVWDGQTVLHENRADMTFECRWVQFIPSTDLNKTVPMCVHKERDIVSGSINRKGRWPDCNDLPLLYNRRPNPEVNTFHIEIGANIGACVMEMLYSTDARIIAFEPNPKNLFFLTATLSKLDKELRNRVTLFPVALGENTGSSTINMAIGNYGNSVVSKIVKDGVGQQFLPPIPIQVEKLDDLLDTSHINAGLMKLDAQGFECYIVNGMPDVLNKVFQVKYESYEKQLSSFEGCSGEIVWDKFRSRGFEVYRHNNLKFRVMSSPPPKRNGDYVAVKSWFKN
jgi:FkbM family methyltransferase